MNWITAIRYYKGIYIKPNIEKEHNEEFLIEIINEIHVLRRIISQMRCA